LYLAFPLSPRSLGKSLTLFLQEGVSLDAFQNNMKKERSTTVLLVKNIPHSTTVAELKELFAPHGTLGRVSGSLFFLVVVSLD